MSEPGHLARRSLKWRRPRRKPPTGPSLPFWRPMSHEIRTPMNGVIGMADPAERDIIDSIASRNSVETISESAYALLTINRRGFLDFSKIEAGRMEIEWTGVGSGRWTVRRVRQRAGRCGRQGRGSKLEARIGPNSARFGGWPIPSGCARYCSIWPVTRSSSRQENLDRPGRVVISVDAGRQAG